MLARAHLIAALRLRYDHHSAQAVFEAALARSGLADQPAYSSAELALFRTALSAIGDRLGRVNAYIDEHVGANAGTAIAAAEPPAAAPVEPPSPTAIEAPQPAPVEPPASPPVGETTVVLTGVDAVADDVVLLCGGSPALGDWDPTHACAMTRDADRWTATLRLPPDAAIEFKFVRRAADGTLTWERGENRTLVARRQHETTWR